MALFVPIPESAFLSVESIIPALFLAGPCGIAQVAAAGMGFFLGKSPDWTRQVKYLPVFGGRILSSAWDWGYLSFPGSFPPQVAAVLMLASFLGGMMPPLVGLGLARGALASRIR